MMADVLFSRRSWLKMSLALAGSTIPLGRVTASGARLKQTPDNACSFDFSLLTLANATGAPLPYNTLYRLPDGDIYFSCPDDVEDVLLAEGTEGASSISSPTTVLVTYPMDDQTFVIPDPAFIHVPNGTALLAARLPEGVTGIGLNLSSHWALVPGSDDSNRVELYDLNTMESVPLQDLVPHPLPARYGVDWSMGGTQCVALMITAPRQRDADWSTPISVDDIPAGFLVLADDVPPRWIELPDALPDRSLISTSPSGNRAVISTPMPRSLWYYDALTMIDLDDGAEVATARFEKPKQITTSRWANDGSEYLFLEGAELWSIGPGRNATAVVVAEVENSVINGMAPTMDPHRWLLKIGDSPIPSQVQAFMADITTGKVEQLPWKMADTFALNSPFPAQYLVVNGDQGEAQLVDPLTGQVLLALNERWPLNQFNAPIHRISSGSHTTIQVLTSGSVLVVDTVEGETTARLMTADPQQAAARHLAEGKMDGHWRSPDGDVLVIHVDSRKQSYFIDLTADTADWIPIE